MSFSLSPILGNLVGYTVALFSPIMQSNARGVGGTSLPFDNLSTSATSAINDIISLSAEATAAMTATGNSSLARGKYATALSSAAETMVGIDGSISFSFSGSSGTPTITGSLSQQVTAAIETVKGSLVSGTALPNASSAVDAFAQVYAQQSADGVAERFYKSTNVTQFTAGMSDAMASSFIQAYNNHALDIQAASQAAGVTETGTQTTSFFGSAMGGGMAQSGGTIHVAGLMKTNQYVMTQSDPFFGGVVISWGGPAKTAS